jgi:hypothetical protein
MNERGKYQKIDGNKIPSVGMILANKLIKITNPPMAVTAPNLLIVLEAIKKIIDPDKGKNKVAIINAKYGSGLKLNLSPFEKGRVKKYTYQMIVNHNAAKAEIKAMFLKIFNLLFVLVSEIFILANSMTTPIEVISIPVINDMCVGLNKPSIPKI